MKSIHPNSIQLACVAAIVWLGGQVGCRTPTGGVANPFLAPDRVPPPATRAILPGQAQPYYPGDPLPVMQSRTEPPKEAPQNSSLAWNSPSDANGVAAPLSERQANTSLASANDTTVAIPQDESDLRFDAPQETAPLQVASLQPPAQQARQMADPAPNQAVVPATYYEPVVTRPSVSTPEISLVESNVVSPWRPPQIPPASGGTASVAISPPMSLAPNATPGMDVQLRAVPSPPLETAGPTTPRIRMPSYIAPPIYNGAAMPSAAIYTTPMPPASSVVVQTAHLNPLAVAAAPAAALNQDGFRPRSAMR